MAAKVKGKFDLTVIGGGIIGLATARQVLLKHPSLKVCILEKESELATHQSKRNSGVVHCGIYYKRGSLKSQFCIKGAKMVEKYCHEKGIAYNKCGKLIVATKHDELGTLHNLFSNAKANQIEGIELIDSSQVQSIQPGCTKAIEAIWSPNTAIVDWQKVALSYAQDFKDRGGEVVYNYAAINMRPSGDEKSIIVPNALDENIVETKAVVNAAGLFSDLLARQTRNNEHPKVVPFKGKYFLLSDRLASTIKTNIYPVPDPAMPFLGVHITPRIDGSVLVGPTSLLSLGYERYDSRADLKFIELYHILLRSGFRKMIKRKAYFKAGIKELLRNYFKTYIVSDVQRFLPSLKEADLIDTNFCGIRAQVMEKDGQLVDDFMFQTAVTPELNKVLHLRNCPSPAATSSLAIAERVLQILEERFI